MVSTRTRISIWVYLRHRAEDVLAGTLKTGEKTANEVRAHEGECELVVVLVVNLPEGVLLGVVVLPEPGEGLLAGLGVGVLALPVVEGKLGTSESLKGVLGLGGLSNGLILLILLLGGLGGSSLGGLGLLLGGSVLDGLINELEFTNNGLVDLLVDDQVEPTGEVDVVGTELLVEDL